MGARRALLRGGADQHHRPLHTHGDDIEIEERPAEEVTTVGGFQVTPDGAGVANPAFDITPARYVTAVITEEGVAHPPYAQSLARLVGLAEARRTGTGSDPS